MCCQVRPFLKRILIPGEHYVLTTLSALPGRPRRQYRLSWDMLFPLPELRVFSCGLCHQRARRTAKNSQSSIAVWKSRGPGVLESALEEIRTAVGRAVWSASGRERRRRPWCIMR